LPLGAQNSNQNSTNDYLGRSSPDLSKSGMLDLSTIGLLQDWSNAFSWAAKNQVQSDLILIINPCLLRNMPGEIGHILASISSENSKSILREWANQFNTAIPLLNLGEAAFQDQQIFANYPRPTLTSSRKLFHGLLETHYLLALCSERTPRLKEEHQIWIERLRLWILVHSLHRSKTGNYQDTAIGEVASKLRMAFDQDNDWRFLYCNVLYSDARDFEEINRFFEYRAERLLATKLKPTLRQYLRELIKVATKTDCRSAKSSGLPEPISFDQTSYESLTHLPTINAEKVIDDEPESTSEGELILADEEAGIDLVSFPVDSRESFVYQNLQGSSILLYSNEETQYLPWSWQRINPYETKNILNWIDASKTSPSAKIQYISLITWLAITIGRTFKRTLELSITSTIADEWSIVPNLDLLQRLPPRRNPGWKPKSNHELEWIMPFSTEQTLPIPNSFSQFLTFRLKHSPNALQLGELWDINWGDSPEDLFKQEMALVSPRVTGGMLSGYFPQRIYENSGDQAFARLLSSHPATALPASCAYANWPAKQCDTFFENRIAPIGDLIELGSMLDPIEDRLRRSIVSALLKLETLRISSNILDFHNAYTAYVVTALFAATGGRPIRDPFESHSHFDFDHRFVFMDDKHSGDNRQSRLVPIPNAICEIVGKDYVAHLKLLADYIKDASPAMAKDIEGLLLPSYKANMPFLFFMDNDGTWKTVSEESIMSLGLYDWPLPLNHFRHRLSQQLRRRNVDPEIIDSILGHTEGGSATHGDYSVRIWIHDMNVVRPLLDSSYSSLGFARVAPWVGASKKLEFVDSEHKTRSVAFGSLARERQRIATLRSIILDTRIQIQNSLNGRSLSELSEKEIDALSRDLLFQQNGMPHPRGYRKYQIFLKRVEREWKTNKKKVKISKRYQALQVEQTPFNKYAPKSYDAYEKLKILANSIPDSDTKNLSAGNCAVYACTLLCIENRITDTKLLLDVMHGKNFRLVILKNQPYLEYALGLKGCLSDSPVRRFKVSSRTASLLNYVLSVRKSFTLNSLPTTHVQFDDVIHELAEIDTDQNPAKFIRGLALLVDQYNVMTLPGVLAALLAGRVETYAPSWRNWVSKVLGWPIDIKLDKAELLDDENSSEDFSVTVTNTKPHDIQQDQLQINTSIFLGKLSVLIPHEDTSDKGFSSAKRRDIARDMLQTIEEHEGMVSPTILILGRWCCKLLFRKVNDHFITFNSITRYLGSLRPPFEKIAYAVNLLDMDDEDLTIFYERILEASNAKDKLYVAERLAEFHRYARREYAIEDPNWNELPELSKLIHVSPLTFNEMEYQSAFRLLLHTKESNRIAKEIPALILMFCYRFGLRMAEALGLLREDIVTIESTLVIHIRNNKFRRLKTIASRRQLPLLFGITKKESTLLASWLARHEAKHGNNRSLPLFYEKDNSTFLPDRSLVGKLINAALKVATGNNEVSLHHARHSAAREIALCVIGESIGHVVPKASSAVLKNAATILLGRTNPSRRTLWAVSRHLGHARRETTLRNYLHFLYEWCDAYVSVPNSNQTQGFDNAIILDELPRLAPVDTSLLHRESGFTQVTPANVLMLFRLLARGRPVTSAAAALSISNDDADRALDILQSYSLKVRLSKAKQAVGTVEKLSDDSKVILGNEKKEVGAEKFLSETRLLRRIKEPAWDRLIDLCSSLGTSKSADLTKGYPDFLEMISPNRQIILWESHHFYIVKSFLAFFKFDKEDYMLVRTDVDLENLNQLLKQFSLEATTLTKLRLVKNFQIDTVITDDGRFQVRERCALVIRENNSKPIRNSIEFISCFIAFCLSCHTK